MKKYIITSDRWARSPVEATFNEILKQAEIFDRDRMPEEPPVEIFEKNGRIYDETGEIIAEEA